MRSDLRQIGRMSKVLSPLAGGMDVGPLVEELTARVSEELDYTLEAAAQQQAAEGFADSAEFRVPAVLASTSRVMVSEWIDGQPFSVAATWPDAERNAAALRYVRFLFAGPSMVGLLHADPHPGNFKLLDDGRLGVVDFGLVARLPNGLPAAMGRILRIAQLGDAHQVAEQLHAEGFVASDVDAEDLLDYLNPFVEPARAKEFQFNREWMREQFLRIKDPSSSGGVAMKLNLPPSYLLIHRVWTGGLAVLSQMNARAAFGEVLEEFLPGYAPSLSKGRDLEQGGRHPEPAPPMGARQTHTCTISARHSSGLGRRTTPGRGSQESTSRPDGEPEAVPRTDGAGRDDAIEARPFPAGEIATIVTGSSPQPDAAGAGRRGTYPAPSGAPTGSCSRLVGVLGRRRERVGQRVLPGTSPRPLTRHHDAGHEQLATPDTPGLAPGQRPGQALLPDRAIAAQRLGLLDVSRGLREEQVRVRQPAGQLVAQCARYRNRHQATTCVVHLSHSLLMLSGPGNTRAVIPGCGIHGPGGGRCGYTGGLQGGGPTKVENLVSVTSYAPNPAPRPP